MSLLTDTQDSFGGPRVVRVPTWATDAFVSDVNGSGFVLSNVRIRDAGGQFYNIMSYGGDASGTVDNLAAFTAAIAAIDADGGYGTITMPAGQFLVSDSIVLDFGKNLVGVGRYGTELIFASGSLVLGTGTNSAFNGTISGITISRDSDFPPPADSIGIDARYYQYASIEDVFVATHDTGIKTGNMSLGLTIARSTIFNIGTNNLWLDDAIQTKIIDVQFGKNSNTNDPSNAFILFSGDTDTVEIAVADLLGGTNAPVHSAFKWTGYTSANGVFQFSHLNIEKVDTVFQSDATTSLINHLQVTNSRLTCFGKLADFNAATELTSLNISNNAQISWYEDTTISFVARSVFCGNILTRAQQAAFLKFDGGASGNKELNISNNVSEIDLYLVGAWKALVSCGNIFRLNGSTDVLYTVTATGNVTSVANTKDSGTQPAAVLPGDITQSAWVAPSLQNSWVNFGSGYADAGYMKDSLGFIHLRGMVKSGTTANATTIFTLPSGYRPVSKEVFGQVTHDLFLPISVDSSGLVAIVGSAADATYISLSGIMFSTT